MLDFLRHILPSNGGYYCIVGIRKGIVQHKFLPSLDGIEDLVNRLVASEYDVYFACAKYESEGLGRKVDNIKELKAFYLDIDCGENKPYESKEDGLKALVQFCKRHDLAKPWVVDSGGGIHAYWELDAPIPYTEWKETATKLKVLISEGEFKPDPAVTADGARILRLPKTYNLKQSEPRLVTVLLEGNPTPYETLKEKINPISTWAVRRASTWQGLNEVTKALLGKNSESSFKKILHAIAEERGCAQLEYIIENQTDISEPLWRAGLSIAKFCRDGEKAIHFISRRYPKYTFEETEQKAAQIKGPYTCDKFRELGDLKLCKKCKHRKTIKSPIVLGKVTAFAEEGDEFVVQKDNILDSQTVFQVPEYPIPYRRGKNGGVYIRDALDEDSGDLIYEHDFYIIKRYQDSDQGDTMVFRLHTPRDGVKEFHIPAKDMTSSDKMQPLFAKEGVYSLPGKPAASILTYVLYSMQHMQRTQKADIARVHMGWLDDRKTFVIGSKEVTALGVTHGPPSRYTENIADAFHKKGTLDEWKIAANLYNRPLCQVHAFLFLSAFGAPLMSFTDYDGITLISKNADTGTGKTTLLRMINSVWGHPKLVMNQMKDTLAHKIQRIGIFHNLPICYDEIQGVKPEEISKTIFEFSQGVGKGRMERSFNRERKNFTRWNTMAVLTTNQAALDLLHEQNRNPQGELARFLEFICEKDPSLTKTVADEIFGKIKENYGIAGEIYAEYLVNNTKEVEEMVKACTIKLDQVLQATTAIRYWTAAAACNLVGGAIAVKLGLLDFDMKRMYKWVVKTLGDMKAELLPERDSARDDDLLGEYLAEVANKHILMVYSSKPNVMPEAAVVNPKDAIRVRMEVDTGHILLSRSYFRTFCVQRGVHMDGVLKAWKEKGILINPDLTAKILKGSNLATASTLGVRCIAVKLEPEIIDELAETNNPQSTVQVKAG